MGRTSQKLHTICQTSDNCWVELHHEGRLTGKLNIKTEWKPTDPELTVDTVLNWIGIDLGTTHTAASYSKKGAFSNRIAGVNVDLIPINLESGRTTLPSVVKMQTNDDPPRVGSCALRHQFPWPKLTLYDAKRLLGMKFDDPEIQSILNSWPFDVVADFEGNAVFSIPHPKTNAE